MPGLRVAKQSSVLGLISIRPLLAASCLRPQSTRCRLSYYKKSGHSQTAPGHGAARRLIIESLPSKVWLRQLGATDVTLLHLVTELERVRFARNGRRTAKAKRLPRSCRMCRARVALPPKSIRASRGMADLRSPFIPNAVGRVYDQRASHRPRFPNARLRAGKPSGLERTTDRPKDQWTPTDVHKRSAGRASPPRPRSCRKAPLLLFSLLVRYPLHQYFVAASYLIVGTRCSASPPPWPSTFNIRSLILSMA